MFFIRPSVFKMASRKLDKAFDTDEFELSDEDAADLVECIREALGSAGAKPPPPWASLALFLLMWLLPLIWHLPEKLKEIDANNKRRNPDARPTGELPRPRARWNPFARPDPEPEPVRIAIPIAGPVTVGGALRGEDFTKSRDEGMAGVGNNNGPKWDGKNDLGNTNVDDALSKRRGSALL
jgi:hypothetical protein